MNILLAGTPSTTVRVAEALGTAGHTICGLLCPFPKPIGRKKIVTPCVLELWARKRAIHVLNVDKETLHSRSISSDLPSVDVLVVADFGYLIPGWLLSFPKFGALNIHPSLLPRWRGATPVPFTLLFGEKETGVSIIAMNEKFDMGGVVAQKKVGIEENDTTPTLLDRCFVVGAKLLVSVLEPFAQGKLKVQPQPATSPTPTARKFTKDDGFVPLEALRLAMKGNTFERVPVPLLKEYALPHTAESIQNMMRALTPWPGLWTMDSNGKRVKVLSSTCEGKSLRIMRIQLEGKTEELFTSFEE